MPDGTRLRLRAVRAGSRWLSKPEWLTEFLAALTVAHLPSDTPAAPRSPAARQRASEAAAASLDKIGIK